MSDDPTEHDDNARIEAAMQALRGKLEQDTPSFETMLLQRAKARAKTSRAWAAIAVTTALVPLALVFFVLPRRQNMGAPSAAPAVQQEAVPETPSVVQAHAPPTEPNSLHWYPNSLHWYPIADPEPLRFLLELPIAQPSSSEGKTP